MYEYYVYFKIYEIQVRNLITSIPKNNYIFKHNSLFIFVLKLLNVISIEKSCSVTVRSK